MFHMTPILFVTSILLSIPLDLWNYLTLAAEEFIPKKMSPFVIGTVILMIAFLGAAFIMGWGAQYFGWDIFRVRQTISVSFFLFCFIVALLYYNISKRVPEAAPLG